MISNSVSRLCCWRRLVEDADEEALGFALGACSMLPRCCAAAGVAESAARIINKAKHGTFFIGRLHSEPTYARQTLT
jgi:hypothetical protein